MAVTEAGQVAGLFMAVTEAGLFMAVTEVV
jgi:hypothetical protein